MIRPTPPRPDRDDRVDAAVADWFEKLERGDSLDRREFLARHPDVADDLTAFLSDFALFQRLTAGLDSPPD